MLELVEGCVVVLVDADELLLESLKLVLVLRVRVEELLELQFEFGQVG